ncbi:glycoside hydrolase [Pseudarthrobacter psychrotolerans]|uniref:endo-1,4-beta-xylanase n=1 Tax=Pseudarthrobacter psychrotolerans TaxID=2697569 RepID=A0A6P1NNN7_9MICC|nr:endo-1,4-beta-xylanase [Pseudarthrobacter psychrotolerans]QHK20050.1 glycoside hydrolase [Pseudarthrobacter psychrotolerans]
MVGRTHTLMVVLASGLLVVLGGCSSPEPTPEPDVTVDLLHENWKDVPGVTAGGDGLQITATARRIVQQDGGGGQPNPPLNLAGTHLVVGGDFTLSATFADVTADASWALYDRPPVIADEFRVEPAGLRLTLQGDDLKIAVFDGTQRSDMTQPVPVHDEHVRVSDPGAPLTVHRSGDTLRIASGADTLSTLPLGKVFSSGNLWLGLSSDSGAFDVTSLKAAAPESAGLRTSGAAAADVQPSADGLQALAARTRPDFRIGAAVALGPLTGDADYAREFVGNFGALTPENAMKPQFLSPQQGVYTFEEADAIIAIAESKGMIVHGHTIAFTEAMPRWMQELPSGTDAERRSSATALRDYVTTVVTHFKGRLDSLDVVNEPFDVDQGTSFQQNIWYRVLGPNYPAVVSQVVHDADPDVKQFINENGADVPGHRQDALLKLALDTNAQGGHIYGVGLQAHVYDLETDAISSGELSRTLATFEAAGLRVRISENDVTDGQGTDAQAEQYATVLATCLRSRACVSYTTWGVDDRYDWLTDNHGSVKQGHDFLFDDGHPTPAYDAMRRALGG